MHSASRGNYAPLDAPSQSLLYHEVYTVSMKREFKLAERRRDVAAMYLRGYKQVEIAVKWKVSQPQISYDLKWLHTEWIKAAMLDVNEAKARELARIDALELEYWRSWEESKDPLKKEVKKAVRATAGAEAYVGELREEIEERVGDSRYLDGVRWCIEQRLKIFGVYAPTKVAPTTPDGQTEWTGKADSDLVDEFKRLVAPANAGASGTDTDGTEKAAGTEGNQRKVVDAASGPAV
mgnify:CR=1 FL=1